MQRLSGMDAGFVYMETPAMHMHVCGLVVLDPSTIAGGYSFEAIKEMLASRLHLMTPFRRRLVQVPFQLHFPLWVEDPDFDIDNHVRRAALPAPGGTRELTEFCGDMAGRPLERTRPLWELWVVEGLEDGHIALFSKIHHSAIDGASGAEMMVHLFDLTPEGIGEHAEVTEEWQPEHTPSDWELVSGAMISRARQPVQLAKLLVKSGQSMVGMVRDFRQRSGSAAAMPFTAPRTMFNGAVTPHRSVAIGRTSLDDMRFVKRTFGTTVNDVVLAATASSLRRWLDGHGGIPEKALVASVPISVRTEDDKGQMGNRVSAMFASLPVDMPDPVERLMAVHESTKDAKEVHGAMGADMLGDWAEFAMPALFGRVARLYSGMKLADRHPPIHNLVVSNIPGPPIPLYCGGARVVAVYPMGPILEGAGLNVTIISFQGNVDFSAIACRELVPDLADIASGFVDAVAELKKAAEARAGG